MHLIPINDIAVAPDRIRKEFDTNALLALKSSILSSGLFHPLLLRSDRTTLVAGERRLRCIREIYARGMQIVFNEKQLDLGLVPCVTMGSDDEAAYLEAEFTENTRRTQLTWQEEAAYIARYQELNPTKRTFEIAIDLHQPRDKVSRALLIAPYLEVQEVADAKDLDEGVKTLERATQQAHRLELAERFGPVSRSRDHTLIHGDMRIVLPTLDAGRFDAIIADPPYGVNAHSWDNMSAPQHTYIDNEDYSNELYLWLAEQGYRTCRDEAHAYFFCDLNRFGKVRDILSSGGWRVFPWPLIYWRGATNGVVPWPECGPRRTYECVAFAVKGNRRTLGVFPDVLHITEQSDSARGAGKPPALYADILRRTCLPGSEVLDPCVGTGGIFDAARGCSVRVLGIEIDAATYAQARERLTEGGDEVQSI